MRPIIVGLDPGITAGFAVIDLKGDIIHVDSSKNVSFHEIINATISHGRPVVVGTDKANVPNLVGKYATRVGAVVISPKDDLTTEEKRGLIEGRQQRNSHENDALACALFALKEFKPLFQKVDSFLENEKKPELADKIKSLLILRNDMTIKKAFEFLTKPKEEKKDFAIKKTEPAPTKEHSGKEKELMIAVESLQNEVIILKKQNRTLKNLAEKEKRDYQNMISRLMKKNGDLRISLLVESKEKTIASQSNMIGRLKNELARKNEDAESLSKVLNILSKEEDDLIPKLKNLSEDEMDRLIRFSESSIIYAESPAIYSESSIRFLKGKITAIVHASTPPKTLSDTFIFINKEKLNLRDHKDFFLCKKEDIKKQIEKSNVLIKVISDYKKSREDEI